MSIGTTIAFSDLHAPFHNRKAWELFLKVCYEIKPERIVDLGDFMDNYAISKYSKRREREINWNKEVDGCKKAIAELESASGSARLYHLDGNHEERIPIFFSDRCPEDNRPDIYNIRDVLGYGDKWFTTPYKEALKIGRIWFMHDLERCGKNALYQSLSDMQDNIVFGHTHRLGAAYESSAMGVSHVGINTGWLGDKDLIDYKHKIKVKREWQHGFCVINYDDREVGHCQPIPIVKNRCIANGIEFKL